MHQLIHMPYLFAIGMGVNDIQLTNEDSKSLHHIKDYSFLLTFATLNPFLMGFVLIILINILLEYHHMKKPENKDLFNSFQFSLFLEPVIHHFMLIHVKFLHYQEFHEYISFSLILHYLYDYLLMRELTHYLFLNQRDTVSFSHLNGN
jgi:hypothetical protein